MKHDFPNQNALNKAEAALQRVLTALEVSIESSVGMHLAGGSRALSPPAVGAALEEAAHVLEEMSSSRLLEEHGAFPAATASKESRIVVLLHSIAARARHAHLLNDSAAAWCQGWLAVQPPPLDEYAPQNEGAGWSTSRWTESAWNAAAWSELGRSGSVWNGSAWTEARQSGSVEGASATPDRSY